MFIFQCILTIIAAITLVRILYLSITFYFPTENHTERHFIFKQNFQGTDNFVHLNIQPGGDVEENPGPTAYDVVDPSQTICADFSQGCRRKFKENAGKQCVAMSLTAVLHNQLKNVDEWDSSFLNDTLCVGNSLKSCLSNSINKPFLLSTDLPEMVSIFGKIYYLQYSNPLAGDLFMTTSNLPHYSLENALTDLFFCF